MRGVTFYSSYSLGSFSQVRSKVLFAFILSLLLCLYSFYSRTFQVTEHFHLLGDQVRDWNWAVKPFRELPNVGTPTSQGGYCLGPIFYCCIGGGFEHNISSVKSLPKKVVPMIHVPDVRATVAW